jgi:hypothetical protein
MWINVGQVSGAVFIYLSILSVLWECNSAQRLTVVGWKWSSVIAIACESVAMSERCIVNQQDSIWVDRLSGRFKGDMGFTSDI